MRIRTSGWLLALMVAGCDPGMESGAVRPAGNNAPANLAPAPPAGPTSAAAASGRWVEARRGSLRTTSSSTGTFHARRTSLLGPQVSGRLAAILVDEGDVVQADQELARLDDTLFRIEVDQRKAALATAEAGLESIHQEIETAAAKIALAEAGLRDAELQLQRMKNLWEKPEGQAPSIPRKLYDDAVLRRDQATASLQAERSKRLETEARLRENETALQEKRQTLRWSEERLAETVVRAPYAAVVTRRLVHAGEAVNSAPVTHLLELQETATLEMDFPLPQPLLSRVGVGAPVHFDVDGVEGFVGEGKVAVILPVVDERTRSFRCRVIVDNRDGRLRPGLLARVRVGEGDAGEVLIVPRKALAQGASGWQATVDEAGQPRTRAVRIGRQTDEEAEVLDGLVAGDRVLVPGE